MGENVDLFSMLGKLINPTQAANYDYSVGVQPTNIGGQTSLFGSPILSNDLYFGGFNSPSATNPLGGNTTVSQGNSIFSASNLNTASNALQGLLALNNLLNSRKQLSLAKDQFNFAKDTTNTNLNNQIKSYNTALTDKINSRAVAQGNDSSYVQDYLNKNLLTR